MTYIGINKYLANCDKFEPDTTFHSPNNDYLISIPSSWHIKYPEANDSSNVIFDFFNEDKNDLYIVSIYKHYEKINLNEDLESFYSNTNIHIIEHGYTNLLSKDSTYFVDYEDLIYGNHSILFSFYESQIIITSSYNGEKNSDIELCRMYDIIKSFKLNEY